MLKQTAAKTSKSGRQKTRLRPRNKPSYAPDAVSCEYRGKIASTQNNFRVRTDHRAFEQAAAINSVLFDTSRGNVFPGHQHGTICPGVMDRRGRCRWARHRIAPSRSRFGRTK